MKTENKVALVLGSVKGIGKGIGLFLAKKGIRIVLNYFDWEESLEKLKQDLEKISTPHLIVKTNLLETDKIPGLIKKVVDNFGRLDILINNIERGGWPVVHGAYNCEQWDLEMATTLRAKQWVLESSLPYLKKSGNGIVINFSSIAGIVGRSGPLSYIFNEGYSAANRGVSLLTETWARIAAPEVRVNEIMLGIIESRHGENTRGWGLLTDAQKQDILNHTLIGRTGTIDDVVKAVWFLINDASFMTGSVIRLDGGYVLGGDKVAPIPKGVL
ncbi:MAG: SDR family oxidoreductase [Desulfobacterium sp.]|nr:SDR family oxidoreductase [Desulfobacterium sp.]MBU3947959.1 SDR family oxidoreductase [Pseudomonadota bacterium]MBU4010256.1 SDR family oxidoreductase [Pseudomonadota bacterium]MBU4036814.1 SDR family oxidoreductase [Pseudomonadota bacterium]